MPKSKRTYEPDEFGQMVLRMVSAYGRRLRASNDPDDMAMLQRINAECYRQLKLTAFHCYHEGWSLARIGAALGVSKQAVSVWVTELSGGGPSRA